jgi:hypothetical protein
MERGINLGSRTRPEPSVGAPTCRRGDTSDVQIGRLISVLTPRRTVTFNRPEPLKSSLIVARQICSRIFIHKSGQRSPPDSRGNCATGRPTRHSPSPERLLAVIEGGWLRTEGEDLMTRCALVLWRRRIHRRPSGQTAKARALLAPRRGLEVSRILGNPRLTTLSSTTCGTRAPAARSSTAASRRCISSRPTWVARVTGEHDAGLVHNSATINLNRLDVCRKRDIRKIFYSSSACMCPLTTRMIRSIRTARRIRLTLLHPIANMAGENCSVSG